MLLILTYLYFWWMVVKASAYKHVSREKVTNRKLTASLAHAKRKGNTHRFLIQITTKGGALSVVQRGIDNVLAGVARYPVLQMVVWVEVITEDADEVAALQTRYRSAVITVTPFLLPTDCRTPKDTASRLVRWSTWSSSTAPPRRIPTSSTTTRSPSSRPTTSLVSCITLAVIRSGSRRA